jgi:methionyl-tRNA synthetase
MLPADVYARYRRAQGHEVLYICATDEHGTPAEIAAAEAGVDVAEFCRVLHERQKHLCDGFFISFDYFGRSSSRQNAALTQHFARVLEANGYIEERTTEQVYSPADGRFLPDRYVVGTCPICGYAAARGDQCENCTNLLDPTDLIEPRSAISGSTQLEIRPTKHLFLLQSKLQDRLRAWVTAHRDWPVIVRSTALKWLDEGLKDRSITRDLSWGIPVDRPGFDGKVFYVWFDAPIEYIGATAELFDARGEGERYRDWWTSEDVTYSQFMAKDNVPFHTLSFPATIMGSGEPWKLVDFIKGFNWLNYYGGKFSTSQHRGIFMSDALELFPADFWRFYLLLNAPENSDVSFTWDGFAEAVNKDFADVYGNLVSRLLKFSIRHFAGTVPHGAIASAPGDDVETAVRDLLRDIDAAFERLEIRKAVLAVRAFWSYINAYLERRAPWKAIAADRDHVADTLYTALNMLRLASVVASPVVPQTAAAVLRALAQPSPDAPSWPSRDGASAELRAIAPGTALADPGMLVPKISRERLAEVEALYPH